MAAWIPVTLFAALAQTFRFVLQKRLRTTALSTAGATMARFVYSWPLLLSLALIYGLMRDMKMPDTSLWFWIYGLAGAIGQILATMCTVALFQHRNFAVGVTFKKTEVLQTAIIGFVFLGEAVSNGALIAILIGLVGVLALSDNPSQDGDWKARVLTPATALGLASGVLFGVAAVGYRGAALALDGGDVFLRAAFGLALLTICQTLLLGVWLILKEPGELRRIFAAWRVAGMVGVTSLMGSLGWFVAFGLQKAAHVKALGQAELIFSFLASTFLFGERSTSRELFGIAALCLSVVLLILIG